MFDAILNQQFDMNLALTNLGQSFFGLQKLIFVLSYVIGFSLVARGLMMYRIFANQTYGSQQRGEIAGPLVFLVVGVVLLYFPTTINTSLSTFFGTSELGTLQELAAYYKPHRSVHWYQTQDVIIKYLKLVGLIAFIRGWIILAKMGHAGAQPGSIGKGIIHVIGGVILINIIDTLKILGKTFGVAV